MRSVIFVVALFVCGFVSGQQADLDHLMSKRILRCDDIHFNCLVLIPKYYRADKIDSVNHIVSYWKNRCGESEPVVRMETLLNLKEKTFTEEVAGIDLYQRLLEYKNTDIKFSPRPRWYVPPPLMEENHKQFLQARKAYDLFTQNIAEEIESQYQEGSLESLICDFYQNNFEPLLLALQNPAFPQHDLKSSYQADVLRAKRIIDSHVSFFTGAWIPRDSLDIVGAHPLIGLSGGIINNRFSLDGTLSFSLIESKNWYVVYDKSKNRHESDRFGGFMAAVEPCYNLLNPSNRSSLLLTAGIGYESITPVKEKEDREAVSIGTFSATMGFGYRFFFGGHRDKYAGIQGRYHFLNFSTNGGTDLNGNAFSIRLIFGGISQWRKKALEQLYYKDNQRE